MAKARKILARRKAIEAIHDVTRTMEMVSTARFKRSFSRYTAARDYIVGCGEMLDDILRRSDPGTLKHPLFVPPAPIAKAKTPPKTVVIVITSDRGLCGGYNAAVLKHARAKLSGLGDSAQLHAVGKRGISQLRFAGVEIEQAHALGANGVRWHDVARMADGFMADFLAGEIHGLEVVFSHLRGAARYEPATTRILPIPVPESPTLTEEQAWREESKIRHDYEFVPGATALLSRLLPTTVRLRLFECFMAASVTEQIARMAAMHSATESAGEMIDKLNVTYNRTRQAQITTELAEILGGRLALEG